jgi:hypothetical protein
MRAPSDQDERLVTLNKPAIEEACRRLARLSFADVTHWTNEGPDTKSKKKKFMHAVGVLECALTDYAEFRNQVIVETREWISKTYGLDPSRGEATKDKGHRVSASWVISEALRRLVNEHEQAIERWIAHFPKHRAWFTEHLRFVAKFRLNEKTISNMKATFIPE